MPYTRYHAYAPANLADRTWVNKQITKAPRWLSTDLRDGNQALIEPMTPSRKRKMFELLVQMGFKEIEVGFPSASQIEFDFVRELIENDMVPDDVTISVLSQSRQDLIERSAESLVGAKRATIHIYNAVAELFRRVVFHLSGPETIELAKRGTQWTIDAAEKYLKGCEFGYEYSPEIFSQTPTDFALEVCEGVMDVWQPDAEREIILNLPATVEACPPDIFADKVEYFCRNISHKDAVCVSVHPHNDRGTAIAAAEFAQRAGVTRVEGCLFGNGERTGNVDLITLAMNLFSQGIDPMLDIRDIDAIRSTAEYCTGMTVPPRQPYSGDLVYTAFAGSHQDAIKKGLEDLERRADEAGLSMHEIAWEAPYLPIDPFDVGRTYQAVIRVNAQSGKGGMAYLMKTDHNLDLPRRLQMEFSHIVQRDADAGAKEVSSDEIWELFSDEYLSHTGPYSLVAREIKTVDGATQLGVTVLDYAEHALSSGGGAQAAAYVECELGANGSDGVWWGVGIDHDITNASLQAVLSAVNRARG
jgi:2-isopropylmalate synthase